MWGGQRWFLLLAFMSHWFSSSIFCSASLFCLHHRPAHLKSTASWASLEGKSCSTTPPVWDIPKELRWRKILPVGRTLSSASSCSPCLGKKWPDVRLYTYSWTVVIGLPGWSGNWKEHDCNKTRKLMTRKSGEKIQRYISEWGTNVKIFVFMWMLIKERPQQRRILIIKCIR